ncbi:hypothetical protein ABZ260_33230 [Streptosporangium sp. NPDC006013]|uniref:hypothetical protein n=1 Tax=Streptosporangium sp. NPDC006013 TaxID=3155596 RepID=UPI0033AEF69F
MTVLPDYSGPFDPGFRLERLSRGALAVLGREWLLHGHLQDRVGVPMVLELGGRQEAERVAIEEWAAASPIYSVRMQEALGFRGDTVSTILKNLQLDIGAPPQFMDFRLRLIDERHGEFELAHCGALLDVEPMGEDWVRGMCHTIEDPTFDATGSATNPRARFLPVHRPPRVPPGRTPHCHWRVEISDAAELLAPHPNQASVAGSLLARLPITSGRLSAEPGGLDDYGGPFDTDFQLEDLSHAALQTALEEVAIQSHLLFRGYLLSMSDHYGEPAARGAGPRVLVGLAGLTAGRLHTAMNVPGDDAAAIGRVLQLHPTFQPGSYVGLDVEVTGPLRVRFGFTDSPIFREADPLTWLAELGGDGDRALDAVVQAVNPRARCVPVPAREGERHAYEAVIDPGAEPAREEPEVRLARLSGGAGFAFHRLRVRTEPDGRTRRPRPVRR